MFWRVTTFTPLSPIEAIMDKEEFTLEELLNEEDIIQECKTANSRLVQYLGNAEVLEKLLTYLTETPEDDLHFKYSYTACEIFCCELDDVMSALISSDTLMQRLFSPLDKPPPLNSTLAGYFGRVVGCLLVKRAADTHRWLGSHPTILPALVRHVDTTSTVEVILRLVGADDITAPGAPPGATEWLSETPLMEQLLETLTGARERVARAARIQRAAQQNVGEILMQIARHQCSPMIEHLTAPEYLGRMLKAAAAPDSDVLQPVLKVAIALLSPRAIMPPVASPAIALGLMPAYEPPAEPSREAVRATVSEIVQFLPHLADMLMVPAASAEASQEQPYGTLGPPLGRQRITVIELGQALLATYEPTAVRAMLDSEFIPRSMDLFRQYPFNSILHSNVVDVLCTLIDALTPPPPGPRGSGVVGGSEAGGTEGDLGASLYGQPPGVGSPPAPPPARNIAQPGSIRAAAAALNSADGSMDEAGAHGPDATAHSSGETSPAADGIGEDEDDEDDEEVEVTDDMPIFECLIDKLKIIEWLLGLHRQEEAERTYLQPRRVRRGEAMRAAYHGHITQLAARLQSSEHGLLQATLDMNRDWQAFKAAHLDAQLLLEDRGSWEVDMPAEQMPGDDLSDMAGVCSMDAYGQSDFDTTDGDIYNVPIAGRYGTEDDDEYADADISLFDDDDAEDGAGGGQGASAAATAGDAAAHPRSHTIDAARGFLGVDTADEDDDEQQAHNDAALAAAAEMGGLGRDTVVGTRGMAPGDQVVNQMAELGLMEATTVDDDDEVVTGGEEEGPRPGSSNADTTGAATEVAEVVEEVEEEEPDDGREGSGVTANWWKIPAPEVPEADVPPPEAEPAKVAGVAGAVGLSGDAAGNSREELSGAAAMVEDEVAAPAVDTLMEDATAASSVAVVEDEEAAAGVNHAQAGSGEATCPS
eukprot:jgi/Ulvmu1/3326/UM155_0009.1